MRKKRKNTANNNGNIIDESEVKIPQSFVIHQGVAASNIKHLVKDFKKVMKPNTAEKLIAKKRNTIHDFVKMSGPLKVSHLIIFSQTKKNLYLKLSRLPQGPTLTFSIKNYSLLKDVLSTHSKRLIDANRFLHAPCLMTNLQPSEGKPYLQICSKMFLDMFPTINPTRVKTKDITRCCLFHYNEEDETFDFRHYAIKINPLGLTKSTSKLIGRKVPNLSSYKELSDFVAKSEIGSESEVEENNATSVNITKNKGRNEQSVIKLSEIGPRLTLELVKVEDGLCTGAVLYHKYVIKSDEELLELQKKKEDQKLLKRKRRLEQEKNIRLKKENKEKHRRRCLSGMNREDDDDDDEYDDYKCYKEEVGEEPEQDLFQRKRKEKSEYQKYYKKPRK